MARSVKRRFRIPWLADFRDPWLEIDYSGELPQARPARWLNRRLESSVLAEADVVTTVSPTCRSILADKQKAAVVDTIYNGYDEEDFGGLISEPTSGFTVLYLGSMNTSRNPEALWKSVRTLQEAGNDINVELVGATDQSVVASAETNGVNEAVALRSAVPYREGLARAAGCSVLLLVINRTNTRVSRGIVPTKLFEYMRTGVPVLGIGPLDGDAADILEKSGLGEMFDWDDEVGITSFLRRQYQQWQARPVPNAASPSVAEFSRREMTRKFSELLDHIAGSSAE